MEVDDEAVRWTTCPSRDLRHRGAAAAKLVATLGLSLYLGWSAPVDAQQFGRWWWDGSLGLAQRGTENSTGGVVLSDFDQQELRAALGVNGFVVHPAIGRFRLGLDLAVTELEGGRDLDTERSGYSAEFSFLPRGSYPFSLFYRRQLYDYTRREDDETSPLVGVADTSEQWGGRFRVRKGPLVGTLFGVNHTGYDFLGGSTREEIHDREFVDWSQSSDRLQHHLRLEHRLREYGTVDLEIEDLTLNFEQRGETAEVWRWQLSGVGIQRQVGVGDDPRRTTDDYRLRTRLYRPIQGTDQLDLDANLGLSRPEGRDSLESLGLAVAYRWRPRPRWEIAPFVSYARQTTRSLEVESPRAGLRVSLNGKKGALDWLVGGGASYGSLERRDATASSDESLSSFSFNASVGHGETSRLRKELEVEAGRNELRLDRSNLLIDLPDLGLPGTVLTDEDFYRLRATLAHRWDSKWLSGWGEWSRREASDGIVAGDFSSETSTATVQYGSRRLTVQANIGETNVDQPLLGDQQIRFQGANARWRPWRLVSFTGSFRDDVREFVLAPDIDGDRLELSLELRVGEITFLAGAFETNENLASGFERSNRGLRWSISRRLAGWLPIVTGTQRRGVIR